MVAVLDGALRVMLRAGARWVPARHLSWIVNRLVGRLATELPPEDAITSLLRLDQKIYKLEGPASIRHGGGVHPKYRLTSYHRFFLDRVRPGERVLDAGCGRGEVAWLLAEQAGVNVVALDYDAEWIDYCKTHRPHPRVSYVLGDMYKTIPEGSFDAIVLSNVLEHLRDREVLLAHLQAAAAPSRMLIRVPLFERDWRVPLKKELGVEWRLDPTHETEYTVDSFRAEIDAAGLVIREMQVRWGEIWAVVSDKDARS